MKTRLLIGIILITLFVSCKKTNKSNEPGITIPKTEKTSAKINDFDIKIKSSDDNLTGSFNINPITINSNGKNYTVKTKKGKHKFYANGVMVYEVKFKESGFKLRDKNSTLLWKVKIYPDKIKISDNEENSNAFVLKNKETSVKVKRNETEVYNVILEGNNVKTKSKILFTLNKEINQYVYAILAIKEIPFEHKLFILSELLNRS